MPKRFRPGLQALCAGPMPKTVCLSRPHCRQHVLLGQIPLIELSRADILRVVQARQRALSSNGAAGGMDLSALLSRVQNVAVGSTQQGILAVNSTVRLPDFPIVQSLQVPTVAFSAQVNGAEIAQTRLLRSNLTPNSEFSPVVQVQFNESDDTQQRMAQLSLDSPITAGVSGFQLGGIRTFSRVAVEMDLGSIQQRMGNRTASTQDGAAAGGQPLPIRDVSLQVSADRPEARLQTSLTLDQIPFPFSVSVPFSVDAMVGNQQLARVQMSPSAITRDNPAVQIDTVFADADAAKDTLADFALNERSSNQVSVTGFQIAGARTFSQIRPVSLSRADLVAAASRQGSGAGAGGGISSLLNMVKSAQVDAPASRSEILINSAIAMPNIALPVPVSVEIPPVSLVGSLGNVPVLNVRTALPKLNTADKSDIQPSVALVFDSSEDIQNRVAQVNLANTSATVSGVRVGGIRILERVTFSTPLALPAGATSGGGNGTAPGLSTLPIRDTVVTIAQDRPVVDLSTLFAVPEAFNALQTDINVNVPISVGFNLGNSQLAQFSTPGQLKRQAQVPLSAAITFSGEADTKANVARFATGLMNSLTNGTQAPSDPIAVRGLVIGGVQTFSRMSLVSVTSSDLLARFGRGGNAQDPGATPPPAAGGASALLTMLKSVQVSSPADQSAINVAALVTMPQIPFPATVNIPPITLAGQLNNIPVMSIRTTVPSLNTQAAGDINPSVTLAFDSSEDVQNRVGQVSFANAVAAATGLRVGGIQTFEQVVLSMALPNLDPNALLNRARNPANDPAQSPSAPSLLGETSVVVSEQDPTINIRSEANIPDTVPFDFNIDLPIRAAVDVGNARITQVDIPTKFSRQDRKVPLAVGVQMSNEDPAKAAVAQFASLSCPVAAVMARDKTKGHKSLCAGFKLVASPHSHAYRCELVQCGRAQLGPIFWLWRWQRYTPR
ncbi:hypothetical protein BCR44DRAFT_1025653 [Catenaria anguillulae PL171]|uniref:Uncharacterized protein n=1 Tax=Catenaria anguillulae PL171 TaxID=765915 RepID=A0A1Y2HT53_9FUNG|nr:hypothetical protein BCR44DRAFT_1025653 [Catenaria anguillulae PL171]